MSVQPRTIESCPFRRTLSDEGATGQATCGLVSEISGVVDADLCRVGHDACRVCCRWFPPTAQCPNPVVASLLYQLTTEIGRRGGVSGCDARQAARLQSLAAANLPTDDDPPDIPTGPRSDSGRTATSSSGDVLPPAPTRSGPRVRSWAVGVTTAPRKQPTLDKTLTSLIRAGWKEPRLFIDGDVPIPVTFEHLPRTHHVPRMGAWPNYYLALGELLMRHPRADAFMLVQDDSLFADQVVLRDYLERVLWPGSSPGIVSLFVSLASHECRRGWYRQRGVWNHCALAFIFPREVAQRFVASRSVVLHRWHRRHGLANIPWRVGSWAWTAQVPFYFPAPSLVQHVGHVSSLWEHLRAFGYRRARWFAGDEL